MEYETLCDRVERVIEELVRESIDNFDTTYELENHLLEEAKYE